MGAWIEINFTNEELLKLYVAPYMGAWIEIDKFHNMVKHFRSLPTWGRGLK